MYKVLITTVVLATPDPVSLRPRDASAACHTVVAEFDTKEEALGACVAVNRQKGSYPMHANYALPLFDVDV